MVSGGGSHSQSNSGHTTSRVKNYQLRSDEMGRVDWNELSNQRNLKRWIDERGTTTTTKLIIQSKWFESG